MKKIMVCLTSLIITLSSLSFAEKMDSGAFDPSIMKDIAVFQYKLDDGDIKTDICSRGPYEVYKDGAIDYEIIEGAISRRYYGGTNVSEILGVAYYDEEGNLGAFTPIAETEFREYAGWISKDIKVNNAANSNVNIEDTVTEIKEVKTDTEGLVQEIVEETKEEVVVDANVTITVDGKEVESDVKPYIKNGRTMMPFRACFEALGATVDYDFTTDPNIRSVWAKLKGSRVDMIISDTEAVKDGKSIIMDIAPEIVEGRTFIPVRYASELLGYKVDWDGNTKTVIITSERLDSVSYNSNN